jgi:Uma2 family endonuclease
MAIPKSTYDYFTYADYLTWDDNKQWELIDGIAYDMSPAPGTEHQKISMAFSMLLGSFFKGKQCQVFAAPFDVRLGEIKADNKEIETVVQPDISIFCDRSKIDKQGAMGAPDLVIEILSESTMRRDLNTKLLLYQRYGVREYWIADPASRIIDVYKPDRDGKYFSDNTYAMEHIIRSDLFPGLEIPLSEVFID